MYNIDYMLLLGPQWNMLTSLNPLTQLKYAFHVQLQLFTTLLIYPRQ